MAVIFASFAVVFFWIWIEIFLTLALLFNKRTRNSKQLSDKKFKWFLRSTILVLFSLIIFYMYLFENEQFQQTINLCIGIIR